MKKIFIYIGLAFVLLPLSCTDDFDKINTDPVPTTAETFDANYLLSQAQYEYSNTGYTQLLFQSMWTQVLASTFNYYSNGDKYKGSGGLVGYQNRVFEEDYRAASLNFEMQALAQENESLSNLYNIGTIMKVLIFQQITDCYGDVPYTEALKAKEGISQPVYDTQQEIYTKMLSELETAIGNLDESKDVPTADLFYDGDIGQWKKFGYSLMLRIAMRLTKVDAATAQTYAEKAAAGGVFESIADNARVYTDNSTGYSNNTSNALRVGDDYREVRWSETFIDYLDANDDPRLGVIAEVPQAGLENNEDQDLAGNTSPAVQIGLPNGYDLNGGATDLRNHPSYPGATGSGDDVALLGNYSRPRTALYLSRNAPNFILTYAQTELLLAEAAVRGWNVGSATASEHYANGVVAAMESLAQFDAIGTISNTTAVAYAVTHPLDITTTESALKMINEQYWVATGSLFNFIETWNNWRRSGYPVLTPVSYPNQFTDGSIPRRIPYQSGEPANNPSNYASAVSRLSSGDTFISRIWWDAN
jgi:hypothetical protein